MKNTLKAIVIGMITMTLTVGCGASKLESLPMNTAQEAPTTYEAKTNTAQEAPAPSEAIMNTEIMEAPVQDQLTKMKYDTEEYEIEEYNTEEYAAITENNFSRVATTPLSTFSIDVDTASYSNIRRFINDGQMPDPGAVRIEEMINYFTYDYPEPQNADPLVVQMEMGTCPWNQEHYIAMIGLKGREVSKKQLPKSNLVFLIDVSGSMDEPNKLPLLRESFKLLVDELTENDRISMVVYAGASGVVLEGARGDQKEKIISALNKLNAGGSTAGAEGIELAYKIARKHYIEGGNNRVILATDGDFNVGPSSESQLEKLIEAKRKEGVFLSVLGFGRGNIKDNKMETLADKGNGNYAYIDTIREAEKVFVSEMSGTLYTIAKDVKLQVEFNPELVKEYRLIGYENRRLQNEDFIDDTKDAGDLGAGHTVTALYEIIPTEGKAGEGSLRYADMTTKGIDDEILFVKIRYKEPTSETSRLLEFPMKAEDVRDQKLSKNFAFATAVAEFGILLRDSRYKGNASYGATLERARNSLGEDIGGYRKEFMELVQKVRSIVQ